MPKKFPKMAKFGESSHKQNKKAKMGQICECFEKVRGS
jgi:hypothetical protein